MDAAGIVPGAQCRFTFTSSMAATRRPSTRTAQEALLRIPPNPRTIIDSSYWPFFSILAQVSRSGTVRLNTGFSGVLSLSRQK